MTPAPLPDALARAVAASWDDAQAHWSRYLLLSRPVSVPGQPSVAQIDLATRQVSLDGPRLVEQALLDCVEAILAHEIGHHVRYPGSLAVHARLRLLERSLIPLKNYSILNLFTDLLINERLGRALAPQLAKVYRALRDDEVPWESDPAFTFYMSVYEELWSLAPGDLMGPAREGFERAHPDHRADAQLLAQNLFHLGPNLYTQYLYFASVMVRYLVPPGGEEPRNVDPYACGCGEPSPDDWADALTPSAAEREAIRRAREEGWLSDDQADRLGRDALERRIAGLPGHGTVDAALVPEVMAAYYRQHAERHLLRPPPQRLVGDAVVPTTLDAWEPGDPVGAIDWLATLVQRGDRLGAIAPLRRERIADDEGYDAPLWQPRVEIYLDVSGSMPDPRRTRNAMTLAAQVLTLGAVRAGGWVRALLYSGDHVAYWTWCRSEVEMSRFLMHYIGGGTTFPFPRLRASLAECGREQPVRVVITDPDFDANYDEKPEHARVFAEAAERSSPLVLLLHRPRAEPAARYTRLGARVVPVQTMEDFPRMAAALACALFDPRPHDTDGARP